jgi:hypothetical protein
MEFNVYYNHISLVHVLLNLDCSVIFSSQTSANQTLHLSRVRSKYYVQHMQIIEYYTCLAGYISLDGLKEIRIFNQLILGMTAFFHYRCYNPFSFATALEYIYHP